MIRVVLVDDQTLVRQGIRSLLELAGDIAIVAEAADGEDGVAVITRERPDVVLLDVRMPDTSGEAIYRELAERDPSHASRVIFLTGDVQSGATQQFIEASGRASVMKPFTFDELTRVVLEQGGR